MDRVTRRVAVRQMLGMTAPELLDWAAALRQAPPFPPEWVRFGHVLAEQQTWPLPLPHCGSSSTTRSGSTSAYSRGRPGARSRRRPRPRRHSVVDAPPGRPGHRNRARRHGRRCRATRRAMRPRRPPWGLRLSRNGCAVITHLAVSARPDIGRSVRSGRTCQRGCRKTSTPNLPGACGVVALTSKKIKARLRRAGRGLAAPAVPGMRPGGRSGRGRLRQPPAIGAVHSRSIRGHHRAADPTRQHPAAPRTGQALGRRPVEVHTPCAAASPSAVEEGLTASAACLQCVRYRVGASPGSRISGGTRFGHVGDGAVGRPTR